MKDDAPSSTALLVAAGVAFQSTHPRNSHLVPPESGRLSREFVEAIGPRDRSGASLRDRIVVAVRERMTVPGLTLHYVLRKRVIEQLVRAATRDGFHQLVVLGAGFDTLALRLSDEMTCVEVDHPATQEVKKKVVGNANVSFVPTDFTRDAGTYAAGRAIFVAESVLLYLDEHEVRRMLRALRKREMATRLIFTFWEPRQPINFRNATWIADWWLRKHGEPGRWAIQPERVQEFVESEGFVLREVIRDVDFGTRARGEHIAVADSNT